jgi:hypothetical protein
MKILVPLFVTLSSLAMMQESDCQIFEKQKRAISQGFSRSHWERKAYRERQGALAEIESVRKSNATELIIEGYGPIADLMPLKGLTRLKVLHIKIISEDKKKMFTNLTLLADFKNLEDLFIRWHGHHVTDLTPLAGLTKLERLTLYQKHGKITDFSPLKSLTNLKYLNLNGNKITDLTPLAGLTNLTDLRLKDNKITDLTPLSGLIQLKNLDLWGNPVSASNEWKLQSTLPNCKIRLF